MKEFEKAGAYEAPLRYFEEISAVPRASGKEERIADYLCAFAARRGLFCYRDAKHNVFVKKAGSAGREHEPPLLMQAHSDMVAAKIETCTHDFDTDGICLVREGDILRADGTTLGADDGAGVAMILAVLADDSLSHPPLECLFTVSEEIGLLGAAAFDYSRVAARRMLNLDSSEEDKIVTGCCGGLRTDLTLPLAAAPNGKAGLAVTVDGLCGGHSGEDIHRGRGNALSMMGELFTALLQTGAVSLGEIRGGDKDNVIPRFCRAEIVTDDIGRAELVLAEKAAQLKALCKAPEDAGLTFTFTPTVPPRVFPSADTARVARLLTIRTGVLAYRPDGVLPDLSRNVATVVTNENGVIVGLSTRSPEPARITDCSKEVEAVAAEVGAKFVHYGAYPGWESPADSTVVKTWQKAYTAVTGKTATPCVIHAGLECGLISAGLPGLEAISVSCDIEGLHTPAERMDLASLGRIYRTVLAFLKEI